MRNFIQWILGCVIIFVLVILLLNGGELLIDEFSTKIEEGLKTIVEDIWYGENNKFGNDSLKR